METRNVFLAIVLSMAIIFGYQYFFVPVPPPPRETVQVQPEGLAAPADAPAVVQPGAVAVEQLAAAPAAGAPVRAPLDISVENEIYAATVSEGGGILKNFRLKNYRESLDAESDGMELIKEGSGRDLPLFFSWGTDPARVSELPLYEAGPV
ncbi:MAG TPA: membrane protein insertase YidC, partial [Desulfurivibrionaceae bacterium]|nr:membrane protein insertase YidC [Desulfurivibrionaceae bacterium]